MHEAKTHLSKLLKRVALGEEVTIRNGGRPVARLVPIKVPGRREFGYDEGRFDVPEDFDSPLPQEVQRAFDG